MTLNDPLRLLALLIAALTLLTVGYLAGATRNRLCVTAPSVYGDVVWCGQGRPAQGITQ